MWASPKTPGPKGPEPQAVSWRSEPARARTFWKHRYTIRLNSQAIETNARAHHGQAHAAEMKKSPREGLS